MKNLFILDKSASPLKTLIKGIDSNKVFMAGRELPRPCLKETKRDYTVQGNALMYVPTLLR